jgi:Protein of unknown function (DUF1573)
MKTSFTFLFLLLFSAVSAQIATVDTIDFGWKTHCQEMSYYNILQRNIRIDSVISHDSSIKVVPDSYFQNHYSFHISTKDKIGKWMGKVRIIGSFGELTYKDIVLIAEVFPCKDCDYPYRSICLPQTQIGIEKEKDLGEISENAMPIIEYEMKNVGKNNLVLYSVKTSSGCVYPEWTQEEVPPGKSAMIKLHFYSKGRIGQNQKTATVFGNFNGGQPIVLSFKCVIKKE